MEGSKIEDQGQAFDLGELDFAFHGAIRCLIEGSGDRGFGGERQGLKMRP